MRLLVVSWHGFETDFSNVSLPGHLTNRQVRDFISYEEFHFVEESEILGIRRIL